MAEQEENLNNRSLECQYAYLYCRDNIGKMVIVGAPAASSEVEQYLSWFRKKHSMEVYYMQVPLI